MFLRRLCSPFTQQYILLRFFRYLDENQTGVTAARRMLSSKKGTYNPAAVRAKYLETNPPPV